LALFLAPKLNRVEKGHFTGSVNALSLCVKQEYKQELWPIKIKTATNRQTIKTDRQNNFAGNASNGYPTSFIYFVGCDRRSQRRIKLMSRSKC